MKTLKFDIYDIELIDESNYSIGSENNSFNYDFVYHEGVASDHNSSCHGIRLLKNDKIIKSAIVCAVGGATGIHENSVVVDHDNILICCADRVFCLRLPDLTLNWVTQTDQATCFGVYKADNAYFTHGELQVSRLDKMGEIIWQIALSDIIVNGDNDEPSFVLHDNLIDLRDFNSNKYTIDFNGKVINEILSETQKRFDLVDKKESKRKWWQLWN